MYSILLRSIDMAGSSANRAGSLRGTLPKITKHIGRYPSSRGCTAVTSSADVVRSVNSRHVRTVFYGFLFHLEVTAGRALLGSWRYPIVTVRHLSYCDDVDHDRGFRAKMKSPTNSMKYP